MILAFKIEKMNLKKIAKYMSILFMGIIGVFILLTILVVNFYPSFGEKPSGKRLELINSFPNASEGKFHNQQKIKETFSWEDYRKIIQKMMKGNPNRTPKHSIPVLKWTKEKVADLNDTITTAVWYGHSAFYLKMNEKNILLDPMFGDYPSPLPYLVNKRFNDTLPISIQDLPVIDIIIFSHDHYDHLDYGSVLQLKEKTKLFIVPIGLGSHLEKWGVEPSKIKELYWYQTITVDELTFTCTPSQHFSGRGVGDKMCTLWSSWVIKGKHNIYFSGDSGYFDEFKTIGDKYGPFDVCLMECGQYDPMWKDIHMFPEETAQAHLDLQGKLLIPIHWGGFTLSLHDWDDPVKRLEKVCVEKQIQMATPKIGEPILIGKKQEFTSWWKD